METRLASCHSSSSLWNFLRCFQASWEIFCPGSAPGFPPSRASGESLHDADEQHFDSKVLLGHRAPHTHKYEWVKLLYETIKTNFVLLFHLSYSFPSCSNLVTKTRALWLMLNDYSQSHSHMIHDIQYELPNEAKEATSSAHCVSRCSGAQRCFNILSSQRGKRSG